MVESPVGFPELVTVASNNSDLADRRTYTVCVNANGSHVGFTTLARNLDGAGETTDDNDTFLRDRTARQTRRVSVAMGGGEALGATPW